MKTVIKTTSAGRRLALATSIITLLGGFAASAQEGLIVNETFDPPTIDLNGWANDVQDPLYQYVEEGVRGSMAAQISGNLLSPNAWFGTVLYQNPGVTGNEFATLGNTVLSFDVKVDRPGLEAVVIGLQSWSGFLWSAYTPGLPVTASLGAIPLGSYTPGKFKTLSVALDDPLWVLDFTFPGPLDGTFDPTGKTYQIIINLWGGDLPDLGEITVTIDNIRLSTENLMVPWNATSTGQVIPGQDGSFTVKEAGFAAHLGNYTETVTFTPEGIGIVEITAANKDKLFGSLFFFSDTEVAVAIENGTGRFKGAKGSYIATLTWIDDLSFTATATGSISTVGSNKK